jgi:hypothetical protein
MEELCRSPRERHTQKRFVPVAMSFSLQSASPRKLATSRPQTKSTRPAHRPSTLQLNRSNVKRKPAARGRTR